MGSEGQTARIGRYRILRRLSKGGMGVVYLGIAEGIGRFERLAAIKMLNPEYRDNESYVSMFLDEARIGARIQHPNLVAIQEVAHHEGDLFIAMDYVHGETLAKLIRRHDEQQRFVPIPYILEIGIAVADALHAMHRGEVIHGDVSPQNIMVGYDGIVRVTDFGVAHTSDNLFQASSSILRGKIGYVAPEQLLGQKQQPWSDIYSLGVVLWEACTNRRLFGAEGQPSTAVAHRLATIDSIERPEVFRPDLPARLAEIILMALSGDPKARFQDARSIGQALRAFQMDHDAQAGSDGLEEYMHHLFADRIEARRIDLRVQESAPSIEAVGSDDELSLLRDATVPCETPLEEIAQAAFAEPIVAPVEQVAASEQVSATEDVDATDGEGEALSGVVAMPMRRNLGWIPLIASVGATLVFLFMAAMPLWDRQPEIEAVNIAKVEEAPEKPPPPKPRPVRAKRAKPKKPKPLLFGGDDL